MEIIDRRASRRSRTRLRSGKIFGADGRFLCDCAIKDRTAAGARVGLFAPTLVEGDLVLLDESDWLRWDAGLVWSSEGEAGLRFASGPETLEVDQRERLAGRYYAVAD